MDRAGPRCGYTAAPHSSTHPEGWRDMALRNPGNLPQGNGANSIRLQQQGLGDVDRAVSRPPTTDPGGGFFICRQSRFAVKNARPPTRSTRGTSASSASARSRSPTPRVPTPIPRRCAAGSRPDPTRCGATATSCPCRRPPQGTLPAGWTPLLRADRLAERLGLKEVWIKNDAANPTHSFKDRVVSIALARARELGLRDHRLRLDRQPGQRRRRPRRGGRAGVLRVHPLRPGGAEGPRHRHLRDQPGRACAATTTTSTGSAPSSPASTTGRS